MTSSRPTTHRIVLSLLAFGVSVTLAAACGHSGERQPAGSSSAQPQPPASSSAPAAQHAAYDISRVDNVKDDFPPGFKVESHPSKTLDQQDIGSSGITGFSDATFDPPQCRSVVVPPYADATAGTDAAGVSAQGDQGDMNVVALRSPKPVPASEPPAGCDRFSMKGSTPDATATAERIPAPEIDGVTTTGVKLSSGESGDDDEDSEGANYLYTAALDDQTSIVVMGGADEQLNPQQFLSDLLVKATAAVRGQ